MNQPALMLPVGEQVLAGMPQAAAAVPRGAPPDGAAFSLMLGEHLWTLPSNTGAGGDETAVTALPAAAEGYDPQAVMQGLLAEIVNLAVDSAGGAEQLAGKLATRIRQAVALLSSGKENAGPGSAAADGASAAEPAQTDARLDVQSEADGTDAQLQRLIAALLRLSGHAPSDPAPAPATKSVAAGERQPAERQIATEPVNQAGGNAATQRATPALLAPLVRQLMQDLFAAEMPVAVQGKPSRTAAPAGAASPLSAQANQPAAQSAEVADAPDTTLAGTASPLAADAHSAVRGEADDTAPLLASLRPASSPSVDWFNSQAGAGRPVLQPALQLNPAVDRPLSVTAAQPAGGNGTAGVAAQAQPARPVGELLATDIALPQENPLRLAVSTVRGSALDPASRFDVTISDPQGGSPAVTLSMELSTVAPEKLYSGQEMQRISEAMERVLSGEPQRTADSVVRSVAVPAAQPATRGTAVPESDNEMSEVAPLRSTSPAAMPAQSAERFAAIPETDTVEPVQPAEGRADNPSALLASTIIRRDRGQSARESETGMLSGTREHAPLHPVDSIQSGGGQQLAMHPQLGQEVPQRLLQFSAPQVGTDVSGYALDEIRQQLMDKVSELRNAGNGLYNLKLDLYPKELGRMIVNIAVRGDNVAMQVAVLNRGQRDQLQRSLDALRDSLEEDGLSVVDMRVLDVSGQAGQQQAAG